MPGAGRGAVLQRAPGSSGRPDEAQAALQLLRPQAWGAAGESVPSQGRGRALAPPPGGCSLARGGAAGSVSFLFPPAPLVKGVSFLRRPALDGNEGAERTLLKGEARWGCRTRGGEGTGECRAPGSAHPLEEGRLRGWLRRRALRSAGTAGTGNSNDDGNNNDDDKNSDVGWALSLILLQTGRLRRLLGDRSQTAPLTGGFPA